MNVADRRDAVSCSHEITTFKMLLFGQMTIANGQPGNGSLKMFMQSQFICKYVLQRSDL